MPWWGVALGVLGLLWAWREYQSSQLKGKALPAPGPAPGPAPVPGPTPLNVLPPPSRGSQNVQPFAQGAPMPSFSLGTANSGQPIAAKVGQTIVVTLPFQAGQGVSWTPAVLGLGGVADNQATSAVYPFGSMTPGLNPDGTAGANPQTMSFGFLAAAPGQDTISLTLMSATGTYAGATWTAPVTVS